jgi:hypothetical protein
MTDLEIVLLCAFAFMVYLYHKAMLAVRYYKFVLVAIGLKKATVIVDENDKSFTIDVDLKGLEKRIS